jgi:hypothetical protein
MAHYRERKEVNTPRTTEYLSNPDPMGKGKNALYIAISRERGSAIKKEARSRLANNKTKHGN